jgi:adenine-specific DNA-methyltransferase
MNNPLSSIDRHLWPLAVAQVWMSRLDKNCRSQLEASKSYKDMLDRVKSEAEMAEVIRVSKVLEITDIKSAEYIFEASLSEDIKRDQGAVYTPDFMIDYIIETCFSALKIGAGHIPSTLDPACGSGGFLIGAIRFFAHKLEKSYSEISQEMFGLDINEDAIQNARLLLDLFCLEEDGQLAKSKLFSMDSLLTTVTEQLEALGITSGVDIVATNPPYVKIQNLAVEYRARLSELFPLTTSGSFTLASLFLARAPEYLKPDGIAGFITPNNVFTSLSAVHLRRDWHAKRHLVSVFDFRHFPIFSASAYTCLIFLDRGSSKRASFSHSAINTLPNAESLRSAKFHEIPYSGLVATKWRLGSPQTLAIINQLETQGTRLNKVVDIKAGLATLYDKAFICKLSEDGFVALGGDGVLRNIEDTVVEKFTKISELRTGDSVTARQKGIIYPFEKSVSSLPVIDEANLKKIAPNAYAHLESWKSRLSRRSGSGSREWYAWGRRQSLTAQGPKLFTKTFDAKPTFYLDPSDGLFANGYSLRMMHADDGYTIDQIKAFLESRFMFAYSLVTSFEIQGAYQCYQKNFIENVCLPPKELLPLGSDGKVLPGSDIEFQIAQFFGIEITHLELCLNSYINY